MKRKVSIMLAGMVFALGFAVGCGKKGQAPDKEIFVYMPDGAPALAMAQMMAEDTPDDGVTYKVVDASKIASKVTYKDEAQNADMCVMPVNLASKHLGNGENYTMLGAVTHGNLYLISKDGAEYTAENLSSLVGKKVGVLQINAVPGLTLKATLNKYNIPWQELTNDGTVAEDKVNLVAITGADAVGAVEADCFMIAEPAATAQSKKGYAIAGDLQALYGGENGYTQAVLVAKNSLVKDNAAWVQSFTAKLEGGAAWLQTASGADIVSAVSAHMEDEGTATSLKAPLLSSAVLERCGIYFTYASACKQETNDFLSAMIAVNPAAATVPMDAFYWNYKK